jgi:hypothetical protein
MTDRDPLERLIGIVGMRTLCWLIAQTPLKSDLREGRAGTAGGTAAQHRTHHQPQE